MVMADGAGGYYGNSSSQNKTIHGTDMNAMGGLQPTSIIKTGTGANGNFTFQPKDAAGNPFMSLSVNIRTSNPNEAFDQKSVMDILSAPTRSYAHEKRMSYLTDRDYEDDLLFLNPDVARWMKNSAKKLNENRDADLKAQIDTDNQKTKLQQAMQLAQLVNSSGSVDNRRGYAAMAKMFGIDVPTGEDQFVGSGELMKSQIAMNNAERTYNLQQEQAKQKQANWEKEFALKERQSDILAAKAASKSGGSGGKPKTYSIGDIDKIKEKLGGQYDALLEAAKNGEMSGDEIKHSLENIGYENANTLALLEGGNEGSASAYAQIARDNAIRELQDMFGPDMSNQDHTWTNNWVSRLFWNRNDQHFT